MTQYPAELIEDCSVLFGCLDGACVEGCGDGLVQDGDGCDDGVENSDEVRNACCTSCVIARTGKRRWKQKLEPQSVTNLVSGISASEKHLIVSHCGVLDILGIKDGKRVRMIGAN